MMLLETGMREEVKIQGKHESKKTPLKWGPSSKLLTRIWTEICGHKISPFVLEDEAP